MSAEVEFRRFRTWDSRSQAKAGRNWWLIVRSLTQRYARSWYVYMVIVLGLFGAVLGLFLMNLEGPREIPVGVSPHLVSEGPMAFIGIGMGLFAMLVTAPSIAEDIRFNAQLFYFSKPMRVGDYMLGKNGFNFLGLAIVGLVPMLVLSIAALSIGPGSEAGIREALTAQGASPEEANEFIARWKHTSVDTWAEALYVAGMPLLAVISVSIGLVGVTTAVSAFTRRAWHAAVGTVVLITGWSILGEVAATGVETAKYRLYHPAGWLDAVTFLPFRNQFRDGSCYGQQGGGWCAYEMRMLEDATYTIWMSHALLIATGLAGLLVTWIRLKRLEGAA